MIGTDAKPEHVENLIRRFSKLLRPHGSGDFREIKWLIDSLLLLAIFYKIPKDNPEEGIEKLNFLASQLEDQVDKSLNESSAIKTIIAANFELSNLKEFKFLGQRERVDLISLAAPYLFQAKIALKPKDEKRQVITPKYDVDSKPRRDTQEIRAANRKVLKAKRIVSAIPYGKDGEELRNQSGKRWKDLETGSDLPDFNELPSTGRRFRN